MRFKRLPTQKRSRIIQCFIEDVPAATAARLVFVNRKTLNTWYRELRGRLVIESHSLPEISNLGAFKGYHERRIAKFNGLSTKSKRTYLIESRMRYQLRHGFASLVLKTAVDLLD